MILHRILKSSIAFKKRALEALELIAQVHGGRKEQKLLQERFGEKEESA